MAGWDTDAEVARAAGEIADVAVDGQVRRWDVDRVVTRLQVPAVAYREVLLAVEDLGLEIIESVSRRAPDEEELDEPSRKRRAGGGGHGGFGHFLRVAGDHPILTADQEASLGRRIHNGDRAKETLAERGAALDLRKRRVLESRVADGLVARNELVTHNVRLAVHVAKRYIPQIRGLSLEFEDIVQEAIVGLNRAAEKFDPSRGFKFSTYAIWWLRQSIVRGIADRGYLIRLPVHVQEALAKVRAYLRKQEANRRDIDVDELAGILDLPKERAEDLLILATGGGVGAVRSLDISVSEDGSATLGDLLPDEVGETVEDEALINLNRDELRRALDDKLTDRERLVIEMRYGLDGGGERTLEQIGEHLGVTRERIRQIQKVAIAKLQHPAVLRLLVAA